MKLGLVVLVALLTFPVAAQAPWTARVEVKGAELRVNDVVVLRTRSAVGGISPAERTRLTAERLRELTRANLEPEAVRVDIESETRYRTERRTITRMVERTVTRRIRKKRRRVKIDVPVRVRQSVRVAYDVETEARLIARGKVLATASPTEAKALNLAKPSLLVEVWASALRKALAIPGITVGSTGQLIPLAEKRVLKFSGAARGPIGLQLQSGVGSPVDAKLNLVTGSITLVGKAIGRDVLLISREGATVKLAVAIQPYAANVRAPLPVTLTGKGVSGDKVAKLVLASARASLQPLEGATVQIETTLEAVPPPSPGKALSVPITISASGPDMLPLSRVLKVPVLARNLPRTETNALFFSNNPERIKEAQTLYVARLSMGTARLLYHHWNNTGQSLWFVAELVNDSDAPTRVQVLGTDAGPVRDTVWVGYRAASDFLSAYQRDSGMVVEIPAHSRVAFQAIRLPNELTLSGLFQLRLISGSAPLVRVGADLPGSATTVPETLKAYPVPTSLESQLQDADQHAAHVYPKPSIKLTARHSVGGRWGFFSVGRAPISSTTPDQVLEGNYGVFYDIQLTLENPTSAPADVRLIFEPAGGMAGAVFLIDGKRAEIPQTNMPIETTLATFRLAPGARKVVPVRTLPLSGSNYPINLIVKS